MVSLEVFETLQSRMVEGESCDSILRKILQLPLKKFYPLPPKLPKAKGRIPKYPIRVLDVDQSIILPWDWNGHADPAKFKKTIRAYLYAEQNRNNKNFSWKFLDSGIFIKRLK